jgi:hypothetical protein
MRLEKRWLPSLGPVHCSSDEVSTGIRVTIYIVGVNNYIVDQYIFWKTSLNT